MNSSPLYIQSTLVNDFYLTPAMAQSLERYYILHWNREYLDAHLAEHSRIIVHQSVEYIPILPAYRGMTYKDQMKLSFRKPFPGTGIPPYVLVRLA